MLDTIQTMKVHILRLESYVEAMNSIQKLEEIPVHKQEVEMDALIPLIEDIARHVTGQSGKTFGSCQAAHSAKIFVDINLVMQVFENMIANGVRYAFSKVNTHYAVSNSHFLITVTDDGSGFTDVDLSKAVLPFYCGEALDGSEHHGLGLYICKVLCEKHQGSLYVENDTDGGGKVTASFLCRVDK
ncbi:ATP-binding protein [Bacillus sp. PK3_68]|uniref:sensor histidine kinase n=1 Tax=Bacillus sp. PK3_68 TaxID=2027408 RepID=UPI00217EFBAF|nr:ATP-binding protein [Bacillus sp. PK3_68]